MSSSSTLQAMCVIETASIARGFVVADAAVKKAPITIRVARPVTPGKFLLVFGGQIEACAESADEARSVAGSDVVDELFLPGVHPRLWSAIDRAVGARAGESIAIVEAASVATTVLLADTALKSVDVDLVRMHLALGVGGKGWFSITGALCDVEAAVDAVRVRAEDRPADRLVSIELIAQPHPEVRGFFS